MWKKINHINRFTVFEISDLWKIIFPNSELLNESDCASNMQNLVFLYAFYVEKATKINAKDMKSPNM